MVDVVVAEFPRNLADLTEARLDVNSWWVVTALGRSWGMQAELIEVEMFGHLALSHPTGEMPASIFE